MSLWQKIKRLVSGNAHDALDSMEDVGTASRQIVREMDEKLQAAESGLLTAESRLILLQNDLDTAIDEVNKWNRNAVEAKTKNKNDLALQCVQKAKEAQLKADAFSAEIENLNESVIGLQKQIDDAYKDRSSVATDLTIMETKMHVANATSEAASAVAQISSSNHGGQIAQMKRRVEEKAAHSKAVVQLNQKRQGADIERQLRDLNATSDEDYLASLMSLSVPAQNNIDVEVLKQETPKEVFKPTAAISFHDGSVIHNHHHYHHNNSHSDHGSSSSHSSSSDCGGSSSGSSGCD